MGGRRIFGGDRGKLSVPDDFDAPLPDDLLDLFEGGPAHPRSVDGAWSVSLIAP